LKFFDKYSKKDEMSQFIKIRPVEAKMFQAERETDGRTDMTKLIVAFGSFANAPNKKL
jgi:hypothetical protein